VKPRTPVLRLLLGLSISAILLGLLAQTVDFDGVVEALQKVKTESLLPLLLLHLMILLLRIHRWQLIVEPKSESSWRRRFLIARAMFIGWFTDSALPIKAGELTRPWVYAQGTQRSFTDILGTVVLERVLDLLALASLFTLAFAALPGASVPTWFSDFAWVGALLTLLGLSSTFALFRWGPKQLSLERDTKPALKVRFLNTLVHFRQGLELFREPTRTLQVLGWTCLIWACETYTVSLTLLACGADFTGLTDPSVVAASASQVVVSTLAVALPQSPAGIGVDQWATILALRPFGIDAATATAVSIIDVFCVLAWVIPIGLIAILRRGRAPKEKSIESNSAPR
jgi:hypothetical protein